MRERLVGALLAGGLLVLAACSERGESRTTEPPAGAPQPTEVATVPVSTTAPTTTSTTTTTIAPTTTSTTTSSSTTTTTPETTSTTATTAPVAAALVCVVEIKPGDSLNLIVAAIADEAVSVESLQLENAIPDPNRINAGRLLDVCIGNGIDDITGALRVAPDTTPLPPADVGAASGVQAQQQKLNELFAGYGLPALTVDGDSGRLTRQQLCAARAALGLPVTRTDMEPGSAEEQTLMSAGSLAIPAGAPVGSGRWALIDQTCQIMFVGAGSDGIVFVFAASTGQSGYPTRDQDASRVFRFDPARENDGWHDSIDFPAAGDNPLNGNMYKPLYFDDGQAIHGANTVPPEPLSHGCVRLRLDSQNALVDWLGLRDAGGPIWDQGRIDLTVTVQGRF